MSKADKKAAPVSEEERLQAMLEKENNRKMIDRFIADVLRDSKRIKYLVFRQQRSMVARTILGGTIQMLRVGGLNNDKMALEELEAHFKQTELVLGNQSFSTGRRSTIGKQEFLILENPANTVIDHCVVANFDKTQLILGFHICKSQVVNYEAETMELAKIAEPLFKMELVQPQPPQPTPVFDFDNEKLKGTPVFIYNNQQVEKATDFGLDPTKEGTKVCFVYLNKDIEAFEYIAQQLVALQKRFDNLVLYTMLSYAEPGNLGNYTMLSPFVSKLNILYDTLGMRRRFYFQLAEEKKNKYQEIANGDRIDDLYQVLLDTLSQGQDPRPVEEDNELIINADGTGCVFQGIPLNYVNVDFVPKPASEQNEEKKEVKERRSLKDNARSKDLYEVDEDEEKKGQEDQKLDEPEAKQEDQDSGEKKKDPLNTYVLAFWNPRHKNFQQNIASFLELSDPQTLKKLHEENMQFAPEHKGEGEENVKEVDDRPYLKLFTCIQGTRQITLNSFEKKIPNLMENSKVILDNDWLYTKIDALHQMYKDQDEVENGIGIFYIYNRQFKQIFESNNFEQLKEIVTERGKKRKPAQVANQ
ncbi:Conserved_hypothetical protein [Hexamita inflata]|uniref:Uncharacterized protein n=1 Tax=Hexamita inflata TaxID=28002 RepID=A0ABP1GHM8_9EUKA